MPQQQIQNPNKFDSSNYEETKAELVTTVQQLWDAGADGDKIRQAFEQALRQTTGKQVSIEMLVSQP